MIVPIACTNCLLLPDTCICAEVDKFFDNAPILAYTRVKE